MTPDTNGWPVWEKFILGEIERGSEERRTIMENQVKIRSDIATLKVKAGLWGLAGGAIPVAVMIAVGLIRNGG